MPDFTKKNKHLTLDERMEIQECLNCGMTFRAMARRIGKDPTTVSKEVKRHILIRESAVRRSRDDGSPAALPCPKLLKAPFVCNPCEKRRRACVFHKRIYDAKHANATSTYCGTYFGNLRGKCSGSQSNAKCSGQSAF